MKMLSQDEMHAEFHRLRGDLDAANAKLQPKIDAYEKKHAEITARSNRRSSRWPMTSRPRAMHSAFATSSARSYC